MENGGARRVQFCACTLRLRCESAYVSFWQTDRLNHLAHERVRNVCTGQNILAATCKHHSRRGRRLQCQMVKLLQKVLDEQTGCQTCSVTKQERCWAHFQRDRSEVKCGQGGGQLSLLLSSSHFRLNRFG